MNTELSNALEGWAAELRTGASAEQVISLMAAALAERLLFDIYAYDPSTSDLDALLEEARDDKRNPLLSLGEEISLALTAIDGDAIYRAVETLPVFQETINELGGDEDEPDLSMIAGDVLVEVAINVVRETWADRREQMGAPAVAL